MLIDALDTALGWHAIFAFIGLFSACVLAWVAFALPETRKVGTGGGLVRLFQEAAVLIRYEGNYGVSNVSVMGDRTGFAFAPMPEYNLIDRHVNAKLEQRKILPSGDSTDADFIRRAYLDLTGIRLPEALEDLDRRRLPCAIRPEHAEALAGMDL